MLRKFLLSLLLLGSFIGAHLPTSPAAKAPETELFVASEGANLFCRTMGQGSPLIVIHGGPGLSQDYLLPQLERLSEKHFVIFYDQRGSGRSTGEINEETMTVLEMVRDLDNVRKAFGLKKVSLVGHSWGGLLALHYALEHPECVDKLILSNPAPASSEEFTLFVDEYMRRTAPLQEEMAKIRSLPSFASGDPALFEQLERLAFRVYCHNPKSADQLSVWRPSSVVLNGIKINEIFFEKTFLKSFDLHPDLKKLRIPTLIIHGDVDIVPLSTARHIHESIADSQFIVLKDCGHFPYVEQPEAYFQRLDKFLE